MKKYNKTTYQGFNGFSIGDRVMKISNKPIKFRKSTSKQAKERYYFTGKIKQIYKSAGTVSIRVLLTTGAYYNLNVEISDIQHIDLNKLKVYWSVWRKIKHVENKCKDYRFSCNTDFHTIPKPKQKYQQLNDALLGAYSLQLKNPNGKDYLVYKCENCKHYHVGSEQSDEIMELLEKDILPITGLS